MMANQQPVSNSEFPKVFPSYQALVQELISTARRTGFGLRCENCSVVNRQPGFDWKTSDGAGVQSLRLVCSARGHPKEIDGVERKRRRSSIRCGCKCSTVHPTSASGNHGAAVGPASGLSSAGTAMEKLSMALVFPTTATTPFEIRTCFLEHTGHSPTPEQAALFPQHRKLSPEQIQLAKEMHDQGAPLRQIVATLQEQGQHIVLSKDIQNRLAEQRHQGSRAAQILRLCIAEQKKNANFVFTFFTGPDNAVVRLMWATPNGRLRFSEFGKQVLMIDSSMSQPLFGMKLVVLTTINSDHQTVPVAYALLADLSVDAFVWLFDVFTALMPGIPSLVIADPDVSVASSALRIHGVVQAAAATYWPNSQFMLSSSVLKRFVFDRAKAALSSERDAVLMMDELDAICRCSESVLQFETLWSDWSAKVQTREFVSASAVAELSETLRTLFEVRSFWVSCFFADQFTAGLDSALRVNRLSLAIENELQRLTQVPSLFKSILRCEDVAVGFSNNESVSQIHPAFGVASRLSSCSWPHQEFSFVVSSIRDAGLSPFALYETSREEMDASFLVADCTAIDDLSPMCRICTFSVRPRLQSDAIMSRTTRIPQRREELDVAGDLNWTVDTRDHDLSCTCGAPVSRGLPCSHLIASYMSCGCRGALIPRNSTFWKLKDPAAFDAVVDGALDQSWDNAEEIQMTLNGNPYTVRLVDLKDPRSDTRKRNRRDDTDDDDQADSE
eukprot:ANDGO_05343.mRNA.1 Putative protein FAR1-RELATED SEQUENCE 10